MPTSTSSEQSIDQFILSRYSLHTGPDNNDVTQLESLSARIRRHLIHREFDRATLMRGVNEVFRHLQYMDFDNGYIARSGLNPNFAFNTGMQNVDYSFRPSNDYSHYQYEVRARVLEFPSDAKMHAVLLDEIFDEVPRYKDSSEVVKGVRGAIATFDGPTFTKQVGLFYPPQFLPNNGFYYQGQKQDEVPFCDTNPSGARRGALCVTEAGNYFAVDDEVKWIIVRNDYKGVKVLSGTSSYIKPGDEENAGDKESYQSLSYLFHFFDQDGQLKTAHIVSNRNISRSLIRRMIEDDVELRQGNFVIGVELERNGAASLAVNFRGVLVDQFGRTRHRRRDHYIVVR